MSDKFKLLSNISNDIKQQINKFADDLLSDDNCKYIIDIQIKNNIDNIKIINIKYININNKTITRIIKIKKNIIKYNASKNILNNIKPFGKALTSNNKAMIEKEISINKISNINQNKNKKSSIKISTNNIDNIKFKTKYKPPINNNLQINTNVYKPPSTNNKKFKLQEFKLKLDNLDYESNEDDINNLLSPFINNKVKIIIPKCNYGKNRGKNKGYAILIFTNKDDYEICLNKLQKYKYNNLIIYIKKI